MFSVLLNTWKCNRDMYWVLNRRISFPQGFDTTTDTRARTIMVFGMFCQKPALMMFKCWGWYQVSVNVSDRSCKEWPKPHKNHFWVCIVLVQKSGLSWTLRSRRCKKSKNKVVTSYKLFTRPWSHSSPSPRTESCDLFWTLWAICARKIANSYFLIFPHFRCRCGDGLVLAK